MRQRLPVFSVNK